MPTYTKLNLMYLILRVYVIRNEFITITRIGLLCEGVIKKNMKNSILYRHN